MVEKLATATIPCAPAECPGAAADRPDFSPPTSPRTQLIMPDVDYPSTPNKCTTLLAAVLRRLRTIGCLGTLLVGITQASRAGSVLFFDEANHTGRWTTVSGAGPSIANLTGISPPFLALNNSVIRTDLDRPVDGSWTLSFQARHSNRQRALWAGVFNGNGTEGYGVLWDSAANGTGVVTLRKFDLTAEPGWTDSGTVISPGTRSGHDPTGESPLAQFELEWDAPTRILSLYVDGVLCGQVFDAGLHAFQRIYLRGNTTSYFDNITFQAAGPTAEVDERFYDLSGVAEFEGDPELDYHQAPQTFHPPNPRLLLNGRPSPDHSTAGRDGQLNRDA